MSADPIRQAADPPAPQSVCGSSYYDRRGGVAYCTRPVGHWRSTDDDERRHEGAQQGVGAEHRRVTWYT